MNDAKLFRCRICGDPYVGSNPPGQCPFCGAYAEYIVEAKDFNRSFDVELSDKDRANVEKALEVEISNTSFYACAAARTDDDDGKQLFKALKKVEAEHASIWKKILKLDMVEIPPSDSCSVANRDNLQESHDRETRAIDFYRKAAEESDNERVKEIFTALVQVETDHLHLSGVRLDA